MLRLALLGPPIVERDGNLATFDTRKSTALLALLAGAAGPLTRDGLAAMLWPESDDARARASLRRTLSVTAAAVGPPLAVSRTTVGLDRSQVWCDLWEFEHLATRDDPSSLTAAASLYRGDVLSGFRARAGAEFDHWQERMAEEHRQRLGGVLSRLVAVLVHAGTFDGALRQARRWLSLDTLHEEAHQAVMRVLALSNQRAAALAQYRSCVRILDEELGVAPLKETTALYEDIRAARLATPSPSDLPESGASASDPRTSVSTGGGSTVPLLGQDRLVSSLVDDLERCGQAGRVATLVGPGGSGKTRIIEAFRDRAGSHTAWIRARCHPGEQWLELGCVTELLRSALDVRPEVLRQLDAHDAAEVARLVPEAAPGGGVEAGPMETPGAQVRFFRAVASTLSTAVRLSGPGVVVIEDVHHIDETSARLLAAIMRRLDDLPALVVLTWRPEVGAPVTLTSALDGHVAAGRTTSYEPRPMGIDEVAQVLDAWGLGTSAAQEILDRTGGLPLLVVAYTEALKGARVGGLRSAVGGLPPDVPTAVRPLLVQRLSAVSQTTAQLLAAAAVLGNGYDAELLRATSGRSPIEVADALDEALARGLLVERPALAEGSPTYEFPYDALRTVAYETCGRARRRLLHGRAADALSRRAEEVGGSARCAAVSSHLERAGRSADAAAWSWRAAQRSMSLYARSEALDHLERALGLGYPATEAHLAIADVLIALGRYRDALTQLEQAAAEEPSAAGAGARIEHRLAAVQDRIGNWVVAAAHLDAALGEAADPVLRSRIVADRAFVAFRSRDPDAQAWASRALDEALASGDPTALAQAHNVAGVLASLDGDLAAAERSLRESLDSSRSLADPGPAVAALNNLARLMAVAGRDDEAVAIAEEALRRGEEHGDVHRLAALHSNLADLLHAAGRSEEAIAHLKEAASTFAGVDGGDGAVPGIWTLTQW